MSEKRVRRRYSPEEKAQVLKLFKESGLTRQQFCETNPVPASTLFVWLQAEGSVPARKKRVPGRKLREFRTGRKRGPYTADERRQAVEAFFRSGISLIEFARAWGISDPRGLKKWVSRYQSDGPRALEKYAEGSDPTKRRGRKRLPAAVTREIAQVKTEYPEFGLKKVRNFLMRFRGVKVSTGTIRKTIREENLPLAPQKPKKRRRSADKIRHFERARPMQLWQSDITSFVLTRHSTRVYLTVFMDDHSRYIVSWGLQLRQTGEFVCNALLDGISRFGKPEEVLTDQGRQYFTWRGKGDFQKLLDREGVRHVVSRSHHPQTLGKCERFWETVGSEFWDKVRPQEISDARERMKHFIAHYNHFRPHQGLEGMVPADRFFGLENEVRKAIERTLASNELRLAIGEAPRAPVFLIGQIGDQPISLHGEEGRLVLKTSDGEEKCLESTRFGHSRPPLMPEYPNPSQLKGAWNVEGVGREEFIAGKRAQEEEKPGTQVQDVSINPGTGSLGSRDAGAAGESASSSSSRDGILARALDQARDRQEAWSPSASNLATVTTGHVGYGGRITDTAQNESVSDQGGTRERSECGSAEAGPGPQAALEEDPRARTHGGDSDEADRDPARLPEPERPEASGLRGEGAPGSESRDRIHSDLAPTEKGSASQTAVPGNGRTETWQTPEESGSRSIGTNGIRGDDGGSIPGSSS